MYFGDKEIKEVGEPIEGKIRLLLEDGGLDVPVWEYEAVKTEEKSDASEARRQRAFHVAEKMLELFRDLNVRVNEIGPYLDQMTESLKMTGQTVRLKAFGYHPESLVEAGLLENEIRLSDWQRQLDKKNVWGG